MKAYYKIICLVVAVLLLGGCAPQNSGADQSTPQSDKNTLTVYYTEYNNYTSAVVKFRQAYPDITVQAVKFADAATMEEQLVSELNTGTGPDVVLFDSFTTLDMKKLARSGTFVPLDDFFENDPDYDPQNYLPGALAAGKVDDTWYFAPLTIRPVIVFSPTATLAEHSITPGQTPAAELFAAMAEHAQENKDNGEVLSFHRAQGILGPVATITGPVLASLASGIFSDDPAAYSKTEAFYDEIRWLKFIHEQEQKRTGVTSENPQNQPCVNMFDQMNKDTFAHFATMADMALNIYQNLNYLRDGVYEEEVGIYPLPTQAAADGYAAELSWYGVITKDCENTEAAYHFLKTYMDHYDHSTGIGISYFTPVRKDQFEGLFTSVKSSTAGGAVQYNALTEEQLDGLLSLYDKIQSVTLPSPKITGLIEQEFLPFYEGSQDYDSCLQSFLRKLTIYLEE